MESDSKFERTIINVNFWCLTTFAIYYIFFNFKKYFEKAQCILVDFVVWSFQRLLLSFFFEVFIVVKYIVRESFLQPSNLHICFFY